MRVLAGCIVRQHPETLEAHLRTLQWQDVDAEIDFYFIDDNDDASSSALLHAVDGSTVVPAGERGDAEYAVGNDTHRWNVPSFHRLAREKQRILDAAVAGGYDAVWLVDSDLLCAPDTLQSLIATGKEVVSAVFWTSWEPGQPPLPQVWVVNPYGFDGAGWTAQRFLSALESRALVRVRGLGACTLIRREALLRGAAFWPLVDGLPSHGMWQGEDRHFCVRAERLHIELWADSWPEVHHVYRPADREWIPRALVAFEAPREPRDWVSFIAEPCEEPALVHYKEHVRGRLGLLPTLPEVDAALREMSVGESRFVRLLFPQWWEVTPGAEKLIRLTLVSA